MLKSASLFLLATLSLSPSHGDIYAARSKQRKTSPSFVPPPKERKPNIVLILTDDQDVELGSLDFMNHTLKELRDKGAEFRHAYTTTPMCCPSRSSLLTGMYVHNHQVYTNNDNCSSTQWQSMYETRSFATYLSNAGYRTGYFGKYLNKYNGSYVPPGWREWGGLIMNSKYYNYSINMNGKKIKHGFDYHKDYYPDLIANDSIAFLRQSKKNSAHKPVMLTMSFPAPHGPEDSAPQYSDLYFNITSHHTPSYDFAPNPDKQWILQVTQKMQPIHQKFTDLLMTKRLQTLQSVDAAVKLVVDELEALGELDNTYIIYTSDHGYHLGQFGLIKGKSFPFEFDVRIPFLVRGPGVDAGTIVDDIVLNIDLAPTFLHIAGVEPPEHMDGRSVLPLFLNSKRKKMKWPDTFLIESSGRRETPYLDAKIRQKALKKNVTESPFTFAPIDAAMATSLKPFESTTAFTTTTRRVYDSVEELPDSLAEDDDDVADEDDLGEDDEDDDDDDLLDDAFDEANNSRIRDIAPRNFASTKLERLSMECLMDDTKFPCKGNQKWYCIRDNGRWRKHKCKTMQMYAGSNKAFRKCACFTENGLVYKKIPLRNITRRHTNRDSDLQHILFTRMKPKRMSQRSKRDTLEHVEGVIKHVRGEINTLRSTNGTWLEEASNLATNAISESSVGCVIMEKGQVNCSTVIYQDKKSWRQSRHQIDNEIHQLKQKLEKLKEIRKHLKTKKPAEEDDLKNVNELDEVVQRASKKKKKNRVHEEVEVSTVGPSFHHRHSHKYETTRGYVERRTTTPSTTTTGVASTTEDSYNDYCHCEATPPPRTNPKDVKRKMKEDRLRRKLRKQRKKDQLEKECGSERMNCFHHDNEHWRTAPMWTEGPFCFCMNANNNTYSCVRTINSTHNFLYCEFTTGLVTYYNLRTDPFELHNNINSLKAEDKRFLHDQLMTLMACKGRGCTVNHRSRGNVLGPVARGRKRKFMEDARLLYLYAPKRVPKSHRAWGRRRSPWYYPARQDKHERQKHQHKRDGNTKTIWQ